MKGSRNSGHAKAICWTGSTSPRGDAGLETGKLDRPDLYVVARFLEKLWRDGRQHRKTDLQLAVRLNYNVYRKYLDWMQEKGLIAVGDTVVITPKGLETYRTLVAWIKDTVGDEHL